jgi:HlyD family secretion protein
MKPFSIQTLLLSVLLVSCGENKQQEVIETPVTQAPERIVGLATVEPQTRIVSLYTEPGGIVTKIIRNMNEDVQAGDVIIEFESSVEQAQLQQAISKLATQQAVINSNKSQLASLEVKVENARVNYERNAELVKSGGVTQQALEDSRFDYESLQADIGTYTANIAQEQSKLNELQADINYYRELLGRKKITAPVNGKILSIDVKIGNYVNTAQAIGDFAPEGDFIAVTEIDELFAIQVQEGMTAYIRSEGKTDTLSTGVVFLTSPYLRKKSLFSDGSSNMEDRRVREVRVKLDDKSKLLIGSRVECVILLNQ